MKIEKGTILDGTYEVVGQIGAGGGGIVYKARHLRLQTDVVIKKIKEEVREKVKLRQEVDILKQLKHPYLPRVYDFLETEDGVYTIMDYIQGEDLDTAIKRQGKFSQKQVKKWAEQLGDVLAYLHSRKPAIIHSDIKPANIMLTESGDICLIDFNISLAAGAGAEAAVGISAGFSPPEQYRDPALYARVTRNYTMQKLSKALSKVGETTPKPEGNKAVDFSPQKASMEKADRLTEEEKTLLLSGLSKEEKTLLLDSFTEEEKTLLLSELTNDEKTVLLESLPEEKKTTVQTAPQKKEKKVPSHYTVFMGKGIDTRSDIYSLGITLYYLLTGIEPPAEFDKRVPILETGTEVSEGFAIILEKMMELEPKDRFQDGTEYYKAITSCHKLDQRYIRMKRTRNGLQLAALVSLFIGILLLFAGTYRIRQEKEIRYQELIGQAQESISTGDYEGADAFLQEAKRIEETGIGAYKEEVYLLYVKGSYEECARLGEQYVNTLPFLVTTEADKSQLGDIYYLVGNAYFELEQYANAANCIEYALQYNGENGLYYRDQAIAVAKLGKLEEARDYLQKGIELGIRQDSICMVQGEICHVKGQLEEAVDHLKQTLSLTQDLQMKKRALLLATDVYKSMGDTAIDEEIALLEQYQSELEAGGSLVVTEYLADAYVRKAQADQTQADIYYEKALELFKQIYDKGYITYQLKENIAILYESMGRFEEAQELLLSMAEEYPTRYEVYKRLSYLEADKQQSIDNRNRDYGPMKSYYEKALELYGDRETDEEMGMLKALMQEVRDGGW